MRVTKPIDLALLTRELAAAGVVLDGLGLAPIADGAPDEAELYGYDAETGEPAELPTEAEPVVEAHDATKPARTTTFEQAEDAERLAIVRARAAEDPAFAALADLTLGKQGVAS